MSYPSQVAEALDSLQRRFALLADLTQAASLLSWDRHTYLPSGAGVTRGRQSAALDAICHEKLSDPRIGEWLSRLEDAALSAEDARLVDLCRRRHDRAVRLPAALVQDLADARSLAQEAWLDARRHNEFGRFAPSLQRMFELRREQAEQLGYAEHPYDALHDEYEAGSTAARVTSLFAELRPALVSLVGSLAAGTAGNADAPLHGEFDPRRQEEFVTGEVKRFGYDFERGRLDPTVHPFAQAMGRNDVRITTRYRADYLSTGIFATFHEAGHGLFEQGLLEELDRSPLGDAVSLGVHESQSRMWENLVGRSLPFWRGAYPRLQAHFPQALAGVDVESFYRAVNYVQPSFVRVEADEVTYNLHVIARFELELAMLDGDLPAEELPEAWNAKYRELLGITPPDALLGCLQDVHWSIGLIGYFPTYTLGNLMSVQLFEAARAAIPDLDALIEAGEHRPLLDWLGEQIHRQGSRYRPDELLERATGSVLDAAPYLRYLNSKFRGIARAEAPD
ncbi:MAG: carboxypeptidase M32 [Trueperaceae bacterium]